MTREGPYREEQELAKIGIQFTLFSAFYSPLIVSFAKRFLADEGLEADWSVAPPGKSALDALISGEAEVVQSALSNGFSTLEKGETPQIVHFAQINEMDGFFLTSREHRPGFKWSDLEGAELVCFGGGQPLAMFKYACHRAGIDFSRIKTLNPGSAKEMDEAFRNGQGDFIQQQGPFPQQLVADGIGHIVTQVGKQIGPCGFSSLAAKPDWLSTDKALAFVRAYTKTRQYMNQASAEDIAAVTKQYFPDIHLDVLVDCISTYQLLGCWTPHIEITESAYERTLDIYEYNGLISKRHNYENVCARPPS